MAFFGGEETFNPLLGRGGVQGAAGNFAGMQSGAFALPPIPLGMAHTADTINMQPAFFDQSAGLAAGSLGYPTTISNAKGSGYGLPSQLGQVAAPPAREMGMLAHHVNPYLDAQGNVTVEGLTNAREKSVKKGKVLGEGWGGKAMPVPDFIDPTEIKFGPVDQSQTPGSAIGNMAGLSETMAGQNAAKTEAFRKVLEDTQMKGQEGAFLDKFLRIIKT